MTRIPYTTRHRQRPPSGMVGFTLIELMVTIAVAAILLAVAVPSFRHLIISNRLTTAANNVVTAVTLARSEAIKRNANVDFSKNIGGEVTYTDSKNNTTTVYGAPTMPPQITLGSVQALVATPSGFLEKSGTAAGYSGLVADISTAELSSDNHRCIYLATGVAITSCTDSAACAAGQASNTCKTN